MAGESTENAIDLTVDSQNDTNNHVDIDSVPLQRKKKRKRSIFAHRYSIKSYFPNCHALPSTDASLKLLNSFESQAELLADVTLDMVDSLTIPPSSVLIINDGRFQHRFTREEATQILKNAKTSNTHIILHASSRWKPFLMFQLPEDFVFAESPLNEYMIQSSEIVIIPPKIRTVSQSVYSMNNFISKQTKVKKKECIEQLIGKNCRFTAAVSESTILKACNDMNRYAALIANSKKMVLGLTRAETKAVLGLAKRHGMPVYPLSSKLCKRYRALFYVCFPNKGERFLVPHIKSKDIHVNPIESLPPDLLFQGNLDEASSAKTTPTDVGQWSQYAALETNSNSDPSDFYPMGQFFTSYRTLPPDSGNEKFLSDFCSGGRQRVDVEPHEADSLKITGSYLVVICCELFQEDFSRLEAARLFRKAKSVGSRVLVHMGVSTRACAFYRVSPSDLTKLPFFMYTIHSNEIREINVLAMESRTALFSIQEFVKSSTYLTELPSKVRLAERLADNTITYMDVTPPKSTPNVPVDTKRNTFMIIDVKKFEMTVSRSDAISFLRSTKSMGLSLLLIAPSMSGVIPVAVYMCSTSSGDKRIRGLTKKMISPIHIDVPLAGASVTSDISPPLVADYDGGSAQISTEAADESNPFSDPSQMNNAQISSSETADESNPFSDVSQMNNVVTTLPSINKISQFSEVRRVDHCGSSQINLSDRTQAGEQQNDMQSEKPHDDMVDEPAEKDTKMEERCLKISLEEEEIALQSAVFDLAARIEAIEGMEDEAMQELGERKNRAKSGQDTIEALAELLEQQETEQLTLAAEIASLDAELVDLEGENTIGENGSFAEDE